MPSQIASVGVITHDRENKLGKQMCADIQVEYRCRVSCDGSYGMLDMYDIECDDCMTRCESTYTILLFDVIRDDDSALLARYQTRIELARLRRILDLLERI